MSNCSHVNKGRHLKRIPSLAEADLAVCWIWGLQDKFDDMVSPKRWNVVLGLITVHLKLICKSSEILAKLIITNCVFKSLKFTKLNLECAKLKISSSKKKKILFIVIFKVYELHKMHQVWVVLSEDFKCRFEFAVIHLYSIEKYKKTRKLR